MGVRVVADGPPGGEVAGSTPPCAPSIYEDKGCLSVFVASQTGPCPQRARRDWKRRETTPAGWWQE